ncbi:hypothetical protein ACFULU_37460, partial [Streptomyces sp. NPDC057284]
TRPTGQASSDVTQSCIRPNSRKAGLSLDVLMHTLSDLGDGKARDLARLCEVAHIGRLNPEEAAIVGALFGLPTWAIKEIPNLDPGQAVWKVGPHYVDVIETVRSKEEARLTDTSSRRLQAQDALAVPDPTPMKEAEETEEEDSGYEDQGQSLLEPIEIERGDAWDWSMPSNVIGTRHYDAIEAARQGRCNEAADLAALGERQDITAHGINSDQAVSWLSTRASVADLCGSPATATQLRATVSRMGKEVEWWTDTTAARTSQAGQHGPPPAAPTAAANPGGGQPEPLKRRTWPYAAVVAALTIAIAAVWQNAADDKQAAYKGVSATELNIDGVKTNTLADWSKDGQSVILSVSVDTYEKAKMVRIDSGNQTAHEETQPLKEGQFAMPIELEVKVPVKDRYQAVQLSVMVGGPHWKPNTRAPHRTIEFRPDETAIDTETGKTLKQWHSRLF